MYNGYFTQQPTRQDNVNMINEQINRLEQMKNQITQQANQQMQQPPSINQTFQLAPTSQSTMKFANTMTDVAKEMVFGDTPFFSKDMSVLWIKNNKGEIKTYELNEIVPKDDKDIQIELLTAKVEELERKIKYEQYDTNVAPTKNTTITPRDDESIDTTIEESKSSSVSKVPRSKTK